MSSKCTGELSLYSWRQTRRRSDVTLGVVIERIGRSIDIALHLVPALIAVVLVVMAFQMAQSPGGSPGSPPRPVVELRDTDVTRR